MNCCLTAVLFAAPLLFEQDAAPPTDGEFAPGIFGSHPSFRGGGISDFGFRTSEPGPPEPQSGLEAAWVQTWFDKALGVESGGTPGMEFAVRIGGAIEDLDVAYRVYYRFWEPTFDRFREQDTDLDGEVHAIGADLTLTAPLNEFARAGIAAGAGGIIFKHDLDRDEAVLLEGGPIFRLVPLDFLYVEAAALVQSAWTDFGRQDRDRNHLSYTFRLALGIEFGF
ncbi:MAG: hypothetical protein HY716_03920 [Planctomycetes bacterium]|nr:hypothetical protein [Planctomycetota bacterium]